MTARSFIITGHVQGVGFRWFVSRRCRNLGIVGWVRNQADGSVEVWAEGSEPDLDSLENLLRHGPPGATVSSVKCEGRTPTGRFHGFDVSF